MKDLLQLNFDFDKSGNRLMERLQKGNFITLFEVKTPSTSNDFNSSVNFLKSMDSAVRQIKKIYAGIALLDKTESIDSWNIANFASGGLSKSNIDNNIIYVSGKNGEHDDIRNTIKQCSASGLRNIVPVSGNGYTEELKNKKDKQPCFDTTHILKIIEGMHESEVIHPGCVVNPFKYLSIDIFPQYFKLVKKINFGAKFIIAQSGWDMMKLQELRWFLDQRELHFPTIARLTLLTPTLVEEILEGKHPGIHISRDFKMILEKERKYGVQQFASAQWRRLQLQASGCRLMGYSGIQIAGIERPEHISTAAERIDQALNEFKDLPTWHNAYMDHISRADMAPFEYRFYLYNNLLKNNHNYAPEVNSDGIAHCSIWEKFHYKLCRSMFSNDNILTPEEHLLSKKLFTGCAKVCSYCRLPMTHYICPETCPKGLANGPCGGSRIDGRCELNEKQCIHIKRTKLACWLNEIDTLEEDYIKHPATVSKIK
jgi:methylenetetrahydrofolate reductase (NADPH)